MRARTWTASLFALWLALPAQAQEGPILEMVLSPGEATALPTKRGISYANGGVIDVAQPNSTTLVVTMSGLTATNADLCRTSVANYSFDLAQNFEIRIGSKLIKSAKLTLEGRVVGLLRTSHELYTNGHGKKCGTAETSPATAVISSCEGQEVVSLTLPARAAGRCEDLSVYNRRPRQHFLARRQIYPARNMGLWHKSPGVSLPRRIGGVRPSTQLCPRCKRLLVRTLATVQRHRHQGFRLSGNHQGRPELRTEEAPAPKNEKKEPQE